MDLMKDWVHAYVHEAISLGLDGPPNNRRIRAKLTNQGNDGTCCRVRVRGPQVAQIIQWEDHQSRLRAVLSDSVSSIRGHFSDDAVAKYRRENKSDIRAGTKGAVMKLANFDILITNQSHAVSVALDIRGFEIIGCEGAGAFGNPHEISKSRVILALAREWLSTGNGKERREIDTPTAQPQAQIAVANHESSRSPELYFASQTAFLSQIDPKKASELPKKATTLPINMRPRSNSTELLDMLTSKRQKIEISKAPDAFIVVRSPSTKEASCDRDAIRPLPNDEPNTARRLREVSHFPRRDQHNKETNEGNSVEINSDNPPIPSPIPATSSNALQEFGAANHNNERSDGPHTTEHRKSAIIDDTDPWKGWKRIRRRDVVIPKDQQELIDSPDAWVPPAAGRILTPGRVPINLLRKWNETQMELHKSKNARTEETGSPPAPQASEPSDQPSTQLELVHSPASSPSSRQLDEEEWPPSSPASNRPSVPPDSSPPKQPQKAMSHISQTTSSYRCIQSDGDKLNNAEDQLNNSETKRQIFKSAKKPSFQSGPEPEPSEFDSSEASELEISFPEVLETSTQDNQIQNTECTQGEPLSSAPPALQPSKGASFTQVKRSPEVPTNTVQRRTQAAQLLDRGDNLFSEDINSTMKLTLETIIPATFGSDNVNRSPPALVDDSDSDDDMARRQLAFELDGFISNAGTQTEQADPRDNFPPVDTESSAKKSLTSPHPTRNHAELIEISKKRKLDSCSSPPSRSPKRRIIDSQTRHGQTTPKTDKAPKDRISNASLRQIYFGRPSPSSAVEKIYHNFKQSYSSYAGDIHRFMDTCVKLQSLRSKGLLEKSIMWDDFVCREVDQYQKYAQGCEERKETPESYEQYFFKRATVPSFRRRNLTVKSLNIILAWHEEIQKQSDNIDLCTTESESEPEPEQSADALEMKPGAAGNPRDTQTTKVRKEKAAYRQRHDSVSIPDSEEWHNCETHKSPSVELGDTDDSRILSGAQKRSTLGFEEIEMEDELTMSFEVETTFSDCNDRDGINPEEQPLDSVVNEPSLEVEDIANTKASSSSRRESKGKQPLQVIDHEASILSQPEDARSIDEAFYTTDSFYPPYRRPESPTQGSQAQDPLASGRSASPSSNWWRDPNTPFKQFARAFTNLRGELGRYRGANAEAVPVDENGVIQPQQLFSSGDEYVEGQMTTMGWEM
ncbi:predicted protein [Uncinocarpus reesii 1704]|uniref:Shelterin complex subunit TPP1/Est3 domain-containing protein n=1 Tax=Uncinocarpus reesii (strain UAMH 1704) TaxID=336963 RepID=C4JF99_UNCRE|nr:uncharacterized protein UREG_02321 [Uncinocarpus reesii 1704]EEP77472.1 predicted protein [Uncinocarpus reesii 1704]